MRHESSGKKVNLRTLAEKWKKVKVQKELARRPPNTFTTKEFSESNNLSSSRGRMVVREMLEAKTLVAVKIPVRRGSDVVWTVGYCERSSTNKRRATAR